MRNKCIRSVEAVCKQGLGWNEETKITFCVYDELSGIWFSLWDVAVLMFDVAWAWASSRKTLELCHFKDILHTWYIIMVPWERAGLNPGIELLSLSGLHSDVHLSKYPKQTTMSLNLGHSLGLRTVGWRNSVTNYHCLLGNLGSLNHYIHNTLNGGNT